MTHKRRFAAILAVLALIATVLVASPGSASPDDRTFAVRVTITNVAPEGGTIQTPTWVAVHDGSFDLYDRSAPVSAELERLAEDGNTGPITTAFGASGAGIDATAFGPGGPIFPGESAHHLFIVDGHESYFSYASMVIPSNDAFVANGNPTAHPIIDASGDVVATDFYVSGAEILDAGSEENDEVPENTAALAQTVPDTGVVEGGNVELHPGFNEGGNILAAIPNGDFTQEGYQALKISFDVVEVDTSPRTIYSVLDGFQEVPAVTDTSAVGYARFKIAGGGNRIEVDSQFWNIDDVAAVHLHYGARGSNGPVVVNLGALAGTDDLNDGVDGVTFRAGALTGPLEGQPLAALIAAIEAGDIYINVHTPSNPPGEMRGQLVPTPEG